MSGPGPGETLDALAGSWRILQLARGHRFSSDDLLCAWAAAVTRPDALRLLDLGAGIGSVGLLTLHRMAPEARLVMVEAQQVSHDLAVRTLRLNGLQDRVTARLGDLREPASVPEEAAFDLITCSPPYIPPGRGVESPVPQRAGARIELRGDVFDYLRTAKRALAPSGRVAVVFNAWDERPPQAADAAALDLHWRCEVFFRAGNPPSLALYVLGHRGEVESPGEVREPIVLRDAEGRYTAGYLALRHAMGHDWMRY
ncbi:MAG: methyltransferase [Pseudomonadota bacterium]